MFVHLKKGFTLIELLVVIAIIAILAAILFPVFAQAREKARQASCLSNMKQIGTAIVLYIDDYDETDPKARSTAGVPNNCWEGEIYPYVKNVNMYYCPSYYTKNDPSLPLEGFGNSQLWNVMASGYGANAAPNGPFGEGEGGYNALTLAEIKSSANLVAVLEFGNFFTYGSGSFGWVGLWGYYLPGSGLAGATPNASYLPAGSSAYNDFMRGRHNAGINVTYADGHAHYEKCVTVWNWQSLTSNNPMDNSTW